MNEIRRIDWDSKLLDEVRAVVKRHGWPDYVEGFAILFEEVLGDPAVRIVYQLKSAIALPKDLLDDQDSGWTQLRELNKLKFEVAEEVRSISPEINVYFGLLDAKSG